MRSASQYRGTALSGQTVSEARAPLTSGARRHVDESHVAVWRVAEESPRLTENAPAHEFCGAPEQRDEHSRAEGVPRLGHQRGARREEAERYSADDKIVRCE